MIRRSVMALPIWLWLALFVVALVIGAAAWFRKVAVTDPRSPRAVAVGKAIVDPSLGNHCRAAIARHELTSPGQMTVIAPLGPLKFASGRDHVRTPIGMVLTERTMGVSYKKGALGDKVTFLIDRNDINTASDSADASGFAGTIETRQNRIFRFVFQTDEERQRLLTWATGTTA